MNHARVDRPLASRLRSLRRRPNQPAARSFVFPAIAIVALAIGTGGGGLEAGQDILGLGGGASSSKVKWTLSVEPTTAAPGDEVTVKAAYDVQANWYLYAPDHDPEKGPGRPLSFAAGHTSLSPVGAVRFPSPGVKRQEDLGWEFRILSGEGALEQTFRVNSDASPGDVAIAVKIEGQACDPSLCIDQSFADSVTLAIATASTTSDSAAASVVGTTGGDENEGTPPGTPSVLESPQGLFRGADSTKSRASWRFEVEPATVNRGETITIAAHYKLDHGWHIYSPDYKGIGIPTAIGVASDPTLARFGKPTFPPPKLGMMAGMTEPQRWLEGEGTIRQRFTVPPAASPGPLELSVKVDFLTCTETQCLLPEAASDRLSVTVSDAPPVRVRGLPAGDDLGPEDAPAPPRAEPDDDADEVPLGDQPLWPFMLVMIGGGLFTLVMPCTYPMIPITISYFTKQAEARSGSVLPLALTYGAGIVVIFSVIGVAFGESIIPFAQSWQLNFLFFLLFVVFALALFGMINLRLPASFSKLAGQASQRQGYLGVFILGTLLVVTSFTCTAPILGGLLFGAAAGDVSTGRLLMGMSVFGGTVAAPFVLLALFPGRVQNLPKAGEWMNVLKVSLGFIELAAAVKFLSTADLGLKLGLLPRELFLVIWAAIAAVLGFYLLNFFRMKTDKTESIGAIRMLSGLAALTLCFYFLVWPVAGFKFGWVMASILPPYSAEKRIDLGGDAPAPAGVDAAAKEGTPWPIVKDDLAAGLELAKTLGKPALINFTGHT